MRFKKEEKSIIITVSITAASTVFRLRKINVRKIKDAKVTAQEVSCMS